MPPSPALCFSTLLFALSIFICVPLLNAFPFDLLELLWTKGRLSHLLFTLLFLGLPFLFSGWAMAFLVTSYSTFIRVIYAVDLAGAAAGAFLPSLLFLPHGDRGVFLFVGLLALLATFLFSYSLEKKFLLPVFIIFCLTLFFLREPPSYFAFRLSPFKPLPQALQPPEARLLLTRWNAISRLDVVSSPSLRFAPGLSLVFASALPPQLGLFVDASQPSVISSFSDLKSQELSFLDYLPSSLPFFLKPKPSVLIIEPKGGLEILSALYFGSTRVKVVESNPLIPSLLRRELAASSGYILDDSRVEVVTGVPRSVLKQEQGRFDLIVFSLPDVFAASSAGLASLREDHLLTKESFIQLLRRLSPEGIIAVTAFLLPPARTELRLLTTMIEAQEAIHSNPQECLIILLSWGTVTIIAKRTAFTPEETRLAFSWAQERLFQLGYYPGRPMEAEEQNKDREVFPVSVIPQLFDPLSREKFYRQYLFEVKPATDNRPFFHHSIKLSRLKQTYSAMGKKIVPLLEGGGFYPVLLFQVMVIASLSLFFPLILTRKTIRLQKKAGLLPAVLPYFGLIGAGFMAVEILFIQKSLLFLGHPVQAVAIAIFSLLFSSGTGSLFSSFFALKKWFDQGWFLLPCTLLLLLDSFLFPLISESFISLAFGWRIILIFLLIFPTGFFLGMPFPTGLARLNEFYPQLIPLAWSTNAFASVTASILASILALWGGYRLLLGMAFFCYASAFLFFRLAYHRHKAHT